MTLHFWGFDIEQLSSSESSKDSSLLSIVVQIKLALFIDSSLNHYMEHKLELLKHDKNELLRVYTDQINFNFSKLKSTKVFKISFKLVEIFYEQQAGLFYEESKEASSTGNTDKILDEFCRFQAELKRHDEEWHIALLLTSKDLYSEEDSRESSLNASFGTLGISVLSGIHLRDLGCSIAEFGSVADGEQSRPHAFARSVSISAWVSTHELAHSLGIHHDGPPFNGDCAADCSIMSATTSNYSALSDRFCHHWSKCSLDTLDQLDLSRLVVTHFEESEQVPHHDRLPGQIIDEEKQCSMSGQDFSYQPELNPPSVVCNMTLKCSHKHDLSRVIAIGPALEGTNCSQSGDHMICMNMECQSLGQHRSSFKSSRV